MPYLGNEVAPLVQALEGKELKLDSDGDSSIQASSDDIVVFKTNSNTALNIDANGHVTKPKQPAFLVNPATAGSSPVQNNISSGDTIGFALEIFDQNGDFSSNTFTAPVTGRYQFNVGLFLREVDVDYTELRIKLETSNRNYDHFDIGSPFSSDRNLQYHIPALADMDASDTAKVVVTFGSGGNQMDVIALSYFSGYLVC